MGNDGGSIPTRDELVKVAKKPEQKDREGHRLYKWQHCALSQEPTASRSTVSEQCPSTPRARCPKDDVVCTQDACEWADTKPRTCAPARSQVQGLLVVHG